VIAQSQPPFAQVAPGTVITLSVSNGKVTLPNVVGKPDSTALATLNGAGFTDVNDSQTKTTNVKAQDGTVASESPTPGLAYPLNTTVHLVIYQYVPPTPTSTTPTATTSAPTTSATSTKPTGP
jgi:serine/threonine-protein kinase